MSRVISDILGASEPHFSHIIQEWESKSGNKGQDSRLISDIRVRAHNAVAELGLDQADTTAKELFFSLQERARQDNKLLAEKLGITDDSSPEDIVKLAIKWLEKQKLIREVWVAKPSVMKTALQKNPPKNLLKTLGLRSVDSMLKRNNPGELLPMALELERIEWRQKFRESLKKLHPKDFDEGPISIHVIEKGRVAKLKKAGYPTSRIVSPCHELGSLLVIPPEKRFPLDVMAIVTAHIEAIADLRRHSAFYRTISVRADFGKQLHEVNEHGLVYASRKLSHIGWGSLHRHLVGNDLLFEKIEQPYLTQDDLIATSAVDALSDFDEKFGFWKGLDYIFFHQKGEPPVSLHLIDVVTNASNRLTHQDGYSGYGRARLWDELWSRYLQHDPIAEQVIEQFLDQGEM